MKKNLISISQFCAINDASVELFSSSFYVKDLRTGVIFLKGITKDEVYKWPAAQPGSSPILAFFLVKTTSSNWHHRLGHPAFSILKHVISNNQLASSSPLTKDFSCNACLSNKSHKLSFSISSRNSTQPPQIIFSMYGPLLLCQQMVSNIMLFLLIISPNTYGFSPSKENMKFRKSLYVTKLLWKIISLIQLSLSILIIKENI
jgi:hypothetical protein